MAFRPTRAEINRLQEALREALRWHEAADKALSKQPPSNVSHWDRAQHQEQMQQIKAALGEEA